MLPRPSLEKKQSARKHNFTRYVLALLISISYSAFCQEIDIKAKLNTTGYIYQTQLGDDDEAQNESILIKPSIVGSYSSKILSASLFTDHSIVKTISDSDSDSQNYTDLKYTGTLTVIENALNITLSGTQNYRNINQEQYFGDKILASDNLTKTNSNNAQLNLSIPNPIYLGFTLQGNYSKIKTDRSQESALGIDSDNLSVFARLYQGRNISSMDFDITAQYNNTDRTNFQSFKSTRAHGNLGFQIINNINFLITGGLEEYDSGDTGFLNRPIIDTTRYGAGFKWSPTDERSVSITYNQLDEGDKQTAFVGLNLDWAFSSRTILNFDYGKRFYGDSYNFDFNHSLKSLRTSITYSEDVTTYSRFGASTTNITGIFVCEFGSIELTDCFQPDSLNYQLQVGEEFRATSEVDTDISEEVLFRKSGTASIAYDKRKIKISINANYSQTEYLESDRLSTTRRLNFNLSYALGRKTDINFSSTVAKNQRSEIENSDTIISNSINFGRNLAKKLNLNIGVRLLDIKSENLERDGSDKRLTVGLNYTF